jgi:hypothetical protein
VNARAWLDAHTDGVPPALAARMSDAASRVASLAPPLSPLSPVPSLASPIDPLIDGGMHALAEVLAATPMNRAQALDLLAADALVTCGFEAAASEPARLPERAAAAMRSIAALAP